MGKSISNEELAEWVSSSLELLGRGPVAAWDLDSTVRNTAHRRHIADRIRAKEPGVTWDDYYLQCVADTPIEGSVALMRELKYAGFSHVAVSGSSELAGEITAVWCLQYEVPLDAVILRKDGDHTPNGPWKVRVLREFQRQGADIRLFFEDWGAVAEQVRQETGIPVVGINPFDSEEMASLGKGL